MASKFPTNPISLNQAIDQNLKDAQMIRGNEAYVGGACVLPFGKAGC